MSFQPAANAGLLVAGAIQDMTLKPPITAVSRRLQCRRPFLIGAIAVFLVIWLFRDDVRMWAFARGVLSNDAPAFELLEEYVRSAPDPQAAILAAWNTDKIVHRHFAIRALPMIFSADQPLPIELESILLAGALDADVSVREAALSGLRGWRHPALIALCIAQLDDPDPHVRLLGVDCLKFAPAELGPRQSRLQGEAGTRADSGAIVRFDEVTRI
jgi:hypothetical protein